MKIVFALALGLGVSLPLASPAFARTTTTSTSPARVARRQKLARRFPQLGLRADKLPVRVGAPKKSTTVTSAARRVAAVPAPNASTLSFECVGFTGAQKTELETFINTNYNLITQVWGAPAPEQRGKTIQVINTDSVSTYFPPEAGDNGPGEIQFDYVNSTIAGANTFRLLQVVLLAFQGPRVPAFNYNNNAYVEPYLLGASEAAALQIFAQTATAPKPFDPRNYADYVLPFYDAFNSPALGNAYIYPASGDVTISDFRLAMAQAAFLKLYTEKASFFSEFNTALYGRGAARSAVTADILESLAAGVVPTVEGIPFRAWVREQGALNARIQTGNKLYAVALPAVASAQTGNRSSAVVYVEAFATNASGDDVPLFQGGTATQTAYGTLDAYDETGRNINTFSNELRSTNLVTFSDPDAPGDFSTQIGFSSFGTPVPARVTFRARLNSTEANAIFPFSVAGSSTAPTGIYGAILSGTTGTIAITSGNQTQSAPAARGVFASFIPPVNAARVVTTLSDGTKTFKRNTAWLAPASATTVNQLEFLLPSAGAPISTSALNRTTDNGIMMIAFPLRPLQRDEAQALNLPAASLSLARFRPDLAPPAYQLYPNISQGPEAGFGYWLKTSTNNINTQVSGTFPPTNLPAELELKGGWNQIGVPRANGVPALNVKVRYGGYSAVTLQDAQARGWIGQGIWRYTGSSGYQQVDVPNATLAPWEGYWVFASPQTGVSLVFDPSAATQSVRAVAAPAGSWSVGLTAVGAKSRDTSASFGISTAKPAAKPPIATRQLTVYFPPTDAASSTGNGTAQGFLKTLNASNEWRFTVDGTTKGEKVTLSWPNFQNAPTNLQLQLRDNSNGRLYPMKSGGNWAFIATGAPQSFSIIGTRTSTSATSAKGS